MATKQQFERAVKKSGLVEEWTVEYETRTYWCIDVWLKEGYTIGDNDQRGDRYWKDDFDSASDAWQRAINGLKTIRKRN